MLHTSVYAKVNPDNTSCAPIPIEAYQATAVRMIRHFGHWSPLPARRSLPLLLILLLVFHLRHSATTIKYDEAPVDDSMRTHLTLIPNLPPYV